VIGSEERLDRAVLDAVAADALGARRARVVGWSREPILGGLDRASTVARVAGSTRVGGEVRPWSAVLKVVRVLPGHEDSASAYYWRREACAYTSGLLAGLADGLVAPRCYLSEERAGELWLWLEDVRGVPGTEWTSDQVLAAARRFGAFHGPYLAGRPPPAEPWVGRGMRRQQAEEAAPGIARLSALAGHPLVRAGWPDEVHEGVLRFWEEDRQRFLDALDRLPQALQHGDASGNNLFMRPAPGGEETVAVDWAWLGVAAVGEDLAVLANWFWLRQGDATLDPLLAAYVDGLRDGGWRGDPRLVRLGWALSSALRDLAHPLMLACLDETQREHFERHRGMPLEAFLARLSRVVRRMLAPAAEARELLRLL
jgi:hypothetical protein